MNEKKQEYWPDEFKLLLNNNIPNYDMLYELRANIVLQLIEHFGAVAGKRGPDNEHGRPVMELQSPEELVERCWKIADLFVEEAEKRGFIKPTALDIKGIYALRQILQDNYWHDYRDDIKQAIADGMSFDQMIDEFVKQK